MANLVTFFVENIRVSKPGASAQEDNPDRVYNVTGKFYPMTPDKSGKLRKADKPQSAGTKYLDTSDVLAEGFVLDIAAGILTIPAGQRGRKPGAELSQEDIAAELEALRTASTEEADES